MYVKSDMDSTFALLSCWIPMDGYIPLSLTFFKIIKFFYYKGNKVMQRKETFTSIFDEIL